MLVKDLLSFLEQNACYKKYMLVTTFKIYSSFFNIVFGFN